MTKTALLASAAVMAALLAPGAANATVEGFKFESADITAIFSLDVTGGQAVSGTGTLWSPHWSGGGDPMTLVTLSTPNVHNLGSGVLSYRFGGGTDLIGDTAVPIDSWGPVFIVNTRPNLDVGFNVWWNGGNSYTGFIAGNAPSKGAPIIYLGENGSVGSIPEPATWAMLGIGFAALGFDGYRARRSAISIA